MFLLFEEGGKFMAGRVLSEAESSAQVELESGKRIKVKAANMLLRFDKPAPAQFVDAAQAVSQAIELELAWEFSPPEEFGFAELARDYFSANATLEQQAGTLFRLYEAPHYFRRASKGRFRKAPADVIALALAAIDKKQQVQTQIGAWVTELASGQCPQPVRDHLYKILFKPDKNAPEYKAVVEAARATRLAPLDLLQKAGAIDSAYQFHWQRFLLENFPQGMGFPALDAPAVKDDLPRAMVQAFSIDDSATTEIDDALSVAGLGSGEVTVGIHIAAPALALGKGSALDLVARSRLSTVYMPGFKITMLPDAVVQAYTLQEGRDCPAVSLYVRLDERSLEILGSETRLERVPVMANLRHDHLDAVVTQEWLENSHIEPAQSECAATEPAEALRKQLGFLYRLARHLKAGRELVRGKPETFNRPDYNFRLHGNAGGEPNGSEQVRITLRQRGAPLDLIVAEAMILANSSWGNWMAELGVPAIYRSQASLAPGVKVRMGTKALPHAGIGVKSYAWSTSPLRRYTDLVNQWQIIACARHGRTAALAAPFKPKDAELFSVISAFDAAYSSYNAYQGAMERFWTLKYLQQNAITELVGAVFKENMVRADQLPLVLQVVGARDLPRAAKVRVKLGDIDEITMDLVGTVVERLDLAVAGPTDRGPGLESTSDDEDEVVAGPIAIAVDVADAEPPTVDNSVS
ncbi:MAG: RNB domain-containing ribonuclease [Rhodoferax sp.]|nr:RNB domain-containing ribonuclease [Rhodoferax sp.]